MLGGHVEEIAKDKLRQQNENIPDHIEISTVLSDGQADGADSGYNNPIFVSEYTEDSKF